MLFQSFICDIATIVLRNRCDDIRKSHSKNLYLQINGFTDGYILLLTSTSGRVSSDHIHTYIISSRNDIYIRASLYNSSLRFFHYKTKYKLFVVWFPIDVPSHQHFAFQKSRRNRKIWSFLVCHKQQRLKTYVELTHNTRKYRSI